MELLRSVNSLGLLAGFCYTQFADTYQEANGLLQADRTPKIPLDRIARATVGGVVTDDAQSTLGSHPHPPLATDAPVSEPVVSDEEPH